MKRAEAVLLAISADDQASNRETAKSYGIEYPLLADEHLKIIDAWGLRHEKARIDGGDAARPALFLIDEKGVVRRRYLTENWRVRMPPEKLVTELNDL